MFVLRFDRKYSCFLTDNELTEFPTIKISVLEDLFEFLLGPNLTVIEGTLESSSELLK